jgi:hypothetical protein
MTLITLYLILTRISKVDFKLILATLDEIVIYKSYSTEISNVLIKLSIEAKDKINDETSKRTQL